MQQVYSREKLSKFVLFFLIIKRNRSKQRKTRKLIEFALQQNYYFFPYNSERNYHNHFQVLPFTYISNKITRRISHLKKNFNYLSCLYVFEFFENCRPTLTKQVSTKNYFLTMSVMKVFNMLYCCRYRFSQTDAGVDVRETR